MHARIGRVSFSPDKADDAVSTVKETVVPRLEETDGFKGFTLLVDRSGGKGLGISFWESEDALNASVQVSDRARSGVAEATEGEDEGYSHYEVAIDTMA